MAFVLTAKVANWLPRPGKAKVTYAEGSSFEGFFNGERIKEGSGKYTWMKPSEEDGEDPQVMSRALRAFHGLYLAMCLVCALVYFGVPDWLRFLSIGGGWPCNGRASWCDQKVSSITPPQAL